MNKPVNLPAGAKAKVGVIKRQPSIQERANQCPLESRLYVQFWMQWLTEHVGPEKRGHTDAEGKKAVAWAKKMMKETMDTIVKWKKDGSPKALKTITVYKNQKRIIPTELHCNDSTPKKVLRGFINDHKGKKIEVRGQFYISGEYEDYIHKYDTKGLAARKKLLDHIKFYYPHSLKVI